MHRLLIDFAPEHDSAKAGKRDRHAGQQNRPHPEKNCPRYGAPPNDLRCTLTIIKPSSQRTVCRAGRLSVRVPVRVLGEEAAFSKPNIIDEVETEGEADQSGCNAKPPVGTRQVICSVCE